MSNNSKENSAQPQLRFPDFRDAGDWAEDIFDEIYSFVTTNSLSREKLNYEHGTIKNIHYGDIHTKFRALFDIKKENVPFISESERHHNNKEGKFCAESDIIFADASEDLDDIGKSIEIVNIDGQKLVAGLHTLHARQKKNRFTVGFGGYLFQCNSLRAQIKKEAQGAKVLGISASRLATVKVSYPQDKDEQRKIADCLSSLDELIDAEEQKLEALQRHKKGLMQELFPAEGESVPLRRFPGFENAPEWSLAELGEKTTKVGSGITPKGGDRNYRKSGRPFVRSQNVGWGELLLDGVAHIDDKTHAGFSSTEIRNNDILLNITGASIGRSALADDRIAGGNVNQHVCIIRLQAKEVVPGFLCQFLLSQRGQNQIDGFQAGGNRQGLNFAQVRSFKVPLPMQFEEQQLIANCLSSADGSITAQSQKLDALRAHKKGLMQGLFPAVNEGQYGK